MIRIEITVPGRGGPHEDWQTTITTKRFQRQSC